MDIDIGQDWLPFVINYLNTMVAAIINNDPVVILDVIIDTEKIGLAIVFTFVTK